MNDNIVIITGVSGSGKTTLQRELIDRGRSKPTNFTTRKPRSENPYEIDEEGDYISAELDEYVFIKTGDFFKKLINQDFLETTNSYGDRYGVSKHLPRGNVVIVLDPVGREQVMEYFTRMGVGIQTYYLEIDKETQNKRVSSRGASQKDLLTRARDFNWFSPTNKCRRINGLLDVEKIADIVENNLQ